MKHILVPTDFSEPAAAAAAIEHARDLSAAAHAHERETSKTAYVCPMDPEVRESKPGACPKCGMALEPETFAAPSTRTEYVCPMHPEIVRDEPGACPICGMALEPRTITLEDAPNPELVDMTRRFWISAAARCRKSDELRNDPSSSAARSAGSISSR